MASLTMTPDMYSAILHAYTAGGESITDLAAARAAGCSRDIARKAYLGHYSRHFAWAPAIRDVVEGAIPAPIMPKVWPPPSLRAPPRKTVPPDDVDAIDLKPIPNVLQLVRPAGVRTLPRDPNGPRPNLPAPSLEEAMSAPLPSDPAEAQAELLARLRVGLGARFLALNDAGPKFVAFMRWLASAMLAYAESMSGPNVVVGLNDLLNAAQIGGMFGQILDKSAQSLERIVALEKKLNPPPPKQQAPDKGKVDDPDKAAAIARRKRAKWDALLAEPKTGT